MGAKMERLLEYLNSVPSGTIANDCGLDSILAECWGELDGANAEGMKPDKLLDRMEDISWDPPVLSFTIERHGETVMRSTRAELQYWEVDVQTGSAKCGTGGYRQLKPMQPRLNVQPIAEEIVALILNRQQDSRLKWNPDGSVRVVIGEIIRAGSAFKETLTRRRKRFREEVERLLANHDWHEVRTNVYAASTTS